MSKYTDVQAYLANEGAQGRTLRQIAAELQFDEKWIAQFSKVLRGEKVGQRAVNKMHKRAWPGGVVGKRYYRPCLQKKYSSIPAAHIEHMIDVYIRDNIEWAWTEMGFSTHVIKEESLDEQASGASPDPAIATEEM